MKKFRISIARCPVSASCGSVVGEMNPAAGDSDLVKTYAREGSETAFQALVSRHVNLVFGAAYRQTGDAGMAEEITQNVFVALARKAPRLAGHETLAGWLHRTAILEAKARIRSELRRQRRESTAASLAELESAAANPSTQTDDLTLLLDEGLLNLRDPDRLALVLRFLEERSLREVGSILGVDEDAARKRVSRALDRLSEFFRIRGYSVPAASGTALLTQAAQIAPAGLATTAANAGLAAAGATSSFNLILIHIMALTKTQTALICSVLAGLPLAWQWDSQRAEAKSHAELSAQFRQFQQELTEADADTRRLNNSLVRARADVLNAQARLASLQSRRDAATQTTPYRWDDRLPVARIPKELLRQLPLTGVTNQQGHLSAEIKGALQLTPNEASAVQATVDQFLANYQALRANAVRPALPSPQELNGRPPEDVRVFEVAGIQDQVRELRDAFMQDLNSVLDPERAELFIRSLRNWIQDDESSGINTGMTIFSADHRIRFYRESHVTDGNPRLDWGLSTGSSVINSSIPVSEIPGYLRPYVEDWIQAALQRPANPPPSTDVNSNQP